MSDPNPSSHWDSLATSLGASPSGSEDRLQQPSPSPEELAAPKKAKPAKRPASTVRPAAWDELAEQFGITPAPITSHPTGLSVSTPPAPPAAPSIPSSQTVERAAPPAETPEESPNFFDERFDFEEPFDLLESSVAKAPAEASEDSGEKEEATEKRSRRRRRRRRRPADQRETQKKSEQQTGEELESIAHELESIAHELETEPKSEAAAPGRREEGESGERRSKRRRPRRGKKRRPSAEGEGVEKSAEAREPAESAESLHDEDFDLHAGEGGEFDEEGQGGPDEPARLGFRGIPKWEEVIGMIIDKNLEARSKRAAANPHQGRGNRSGKRRS